VHMYVQDNSMVTLDWARKSMEKDDLKKAQIL
jgi:hypothetical protein